MTTPGEVSKLTANEVIGAPALEWTASAGPLEARYNVVVDPAGRRSPALETRGLVLGPRQQHIFSMAGKDERSKLPDAAHKPREAAAVSSSAEIAAFLNQARQLTRPTAGQRGRLLFALDATMSRQPTWDMACVLQAEMFTSIPKSAGLDVQLLYFRGLGECRASKWTDNAEELSRLMTGLVCQGGHTQIAKVFAHARAEHARNKLDAVVFVGDAMEERVDDLAEKAGQLGLLGCPLFIFQEGRDAQVEAAFRKFARLSKGAYARFDASAADQLKSLLRAVAAFATGGRDLLKLQKSASAVALLEQLS